MTPVTHSAVRDLVERVCAGDIRSLARAISLVENDAPEASEVLSGCFAHAGDALHDLYKRLNAASDGGEFEADFNSGALAIEFEEPPAKFVVSPNAPVRQIWVSAHSRSFKLDWDGGREEFVLAGTGQSLAEMVGGAISEQIGQEVKL